MKLKQLVLNTNAQNNLNQNEKVVFNMLDKYLDYIFRIDEKEVLDNVRKLNFKNYYTQKNVNDLTKYYMQFHTQDNVWLTRYVRMMVQFIQRMRREGGFEPVTRNEKSDLPVAVVQKYIATSPKFAAKRDKYAQAIVKAFIIVHKNDEQDFLYNREEMKAERADEFYDQKFRDHVIEAMASLNISEKNIESGVELNRALWLPAARKQTFNNRKTNDISGKDSRLLGTKTPCLMLKLDEIEFQLFLKWNKLSDYNYYQRHHEIIDQLRITKNINKFNVKKKNQLMHEIFDLSQKYNEQLNVCYNALADIKVNDNCQGK